MRHLYAPQTKTRSRAIVLLRVLVSCLLFTCISYRCGHLKPPQQFRKFSFVCAASCSARKTSLRHPCLSEVFFRMRRIRAALGKLPYDIRVLRDRTFVISPSCPFRRLYRTSVHLLLSFQSSCGYYLYPPLNRRRYR